MFPGWPPMGVPPMPPGQPPPATPQEPSPGAAASAAASSLPPQGTHVKKYCHLFILCLHSCYIITNTG